MFTILKALPDNATRQHIIKKDSTRNSFVRDRDRILFSKEFRRLGGKTQVFVNGFDDHIRNRLTHTLEVAQISKTIARNMGFDEDLCTAISYAHDVGHTPFGHTGERILNHFTNNCDPKIKIRALSPDELGFKHNWQGVKVVSTLEKISGNHIGLNLTNYTLWGILNHSDLTYKPCKHYDCDYCNFMNLHNKCSVEDHQPLLTHYEKYNNINSCDSWTFEGIIVSVADEIAQRHHDIEDGLLAGIINKDELIDFFKSNFKIFLREHEERHIDNINKAENINNCLHEIASLVLQFYSHYLKENTVNQINSLIETYQIKTDKNFQKHKHDIYNSGLYANLLNYESSFYTCDQKFKKFLSKKIINSHLAQSMDGKANYILRKLISAYMTNPNQLPDGTTQKIIKSYYDNFGGTKEININDYRSEVNELSSQSDPNFQNILSRTITDFIAGMTDSFALSQYKMLYGSENNWHH